ncbi:MAG: protein kinase [Acidobacteriota bacterium]
MSTSLTLIGRYQVVRRLGSGGMGSVYLARDPELDRAVAIKLVKDDLTDDPELRERFSREARSAARLRHPNIITIFDIGEHEGRPFIAMEYLPGESLADIIRRQPAIELSRVLRWMENLSRGLAHAHRAGIVHRDIKPANLMVDPDGVLKIVDFGIARLGDSSLTRDGMLVGTANYMAPEQLLGSGADRRCDIFAVGAVFYELLTARKAFPGTIADGLFNRICHEPPEPLAKLCPDLDPEVQRIVAMALEKDPARRYQDLDTVAHDIANERLGLFGGLDDAGPGGLGSPDAMLTSAPTATSRPGATPNAGRTPYPGSTPPSGSARSQATPRSGATPAPSGVSAPLVTPVPSAYGTTPAARGVPGTGEDVQTQRKRRAEVFLDAAEMALGQRDFAKAKALLDDAARFDSQAPGLVEMRAQVEREAAQVEDAERLRRQADDELRTASGCLSRGEFAQARQHLERVLAIDPGNFQAASFSTRLQRAETATRSAPSRPRVRSHAPSGRLPIFWIVGGGAVLLAATAALYLALR